jgi:indole-3-glycerol phosphate synthase
VQGNGDWRPPIGPLGRLTERARARASALESRRAELTAAAGDASRPPSMREALRAGNVSVIAELKRRSPSKGIINASLSAAEQAGAYRRGGASAISVLTEPEEFGGSIEDIAAARGAGSLPVLKKDFHVSDVQLVEARALGASAALLIARAIPPHELPRLASIAAEIGLEALIEVRDEGELDRALAIPNVMIGINNRDLETLIIHPDTAERLLPLVPADRVAIAESGMSSPADVERMARAGADAVLIGSSLSASPDPAALLRQLSSIPADRRARAR